MTHGLMSFGFGQLLLTPGDAHRVLEFFFPLDMRRVAADALTDDDRAFAQGMLVAALDETRRLEAGAPPPAEGEDAVPMVAAGWIRIQGLFRRFVARANPAWFANAPAPGIAPHVVTEVARARIAIPYRAIWISRSGGAPLL